MLALFAYDFPHRKTQRFIELLATNGFTDLVVFAAPFQKLKVKTTPDPLQPLKTNDPLLHPRVLADAFGFTYVQTPHNDVEKISTAIKEHSIRRGLISGARILSSRIINLFENGVINIHPGHLPETAGLDAFWRTIKTGVLAGNTCHFINEKIDAGECIGFEPISIQPRDTPEIVQNKILSGQVTQLYKLLPQLHSDIATTPINWVGSNSPMSLDQKVECLKMFEDWKLNHIIANKSLQLFAACATGDRAMVEDLVERTPYFLNSKNEHGWSPVIVAAYNQNTDTVKYLLEQGADPNDIGKNGTTVLMYAKTKILEEKSNDFSLLDVLVEAGSDINRCDQYGKTVIDYSLDHPPLKDYLVKKGR